MIAWKPNGVVKPSASMKTIFDENANDTLMRSAGKTSAVGNSPENKIKIRNRNRAVHVVTRFDSKVFCQDKKRPKEK